MLFTATASIFLLQLDMLFSFITENYNSIHDIIISFTLLLGAIHTRRLQHQVKMMEEDVNTLTENLEFMREEVDALLKHKNSCPKKCEENISKKSVKKMLKRAAKKNKKQITNAITDMKEFTLNECDDVYGDIKMEVRCIHADLEDIEDELITINQLMKQNNITADTKTTDTKTTDTKTADTKTTRTECEL